MLAGSALSYFGLMHAYQLVPQAGVINDLRPGAAGDFALIYLVAAGILILLDLYRKKAAGKS